MTISTSSEPNEPPPSIKFQAIVSSCIIFGTIGIVVFLNSLKKGPSMIGENTNGTEGTLVEIIRVKPFDQDIKINISGLVIPFREITIAAEVTGPITEKSQNCRAGQFVKSTENEYLLKIDSQRYQLAKDRVLAEINEANARLKKAEDELTGESKILELTIDDQQSQEQEWKRRKLLFESAAISETEWVVAQKNFNAAKKALASQQNRINSLKNEMTALNSLVILKQNQLEVAEIDLDNATVRAPGTGVIVSTKVEKNDFVQPGSSLFVFEDTSEAEVRCDLRVDQLQSVLDTQTAAEEGLQFELPKLPATIRYQRNDIVYEWEGILDRYDGLGLDERTRTAPCLVRVKKTLSKSGNLTLVRGMFVTVELNLGKKNGLLDIPAKGLRADKTVWRMQDNRLRIVPVKVFSFYSLGRDGQRAVIHHRPDDFTVGHQLITSPIPLPSDNMKLRIANPNELESEIQDISKINSDTAVDGFQPAKPSGPNGSKS